ncbi:tetratricopeptide repeat protein [Peribacillus kribbensis]|uniref:tetratricopeptide repeat protein n=1 Tax=Peribacillus kribbensis TaxID=356658 RepID=UPI0003F99358|nr:tetratricopeptide repeat protein [Peribacillus kribbensis]
MRGNKKKIDRDRKVIPFPGLSDRLIERGLDALREKKYKEAAALFSQAKEMDAENPELNIGLVVSLVELGNYLEAKELCRELLHKGIGDYFQVVNIYLMILLNLNEHQEMIVTLKALLEEKQVPPDKEEHFYKMLEFCERSMEEIEYSGKGLDEDELSLKEDMALLSDKSEEEQFLLISQLAHANIRPYLQQIRQFLKEETGHAFLKTLLINILKEQELQEEIEIVKFGRSSTVTPADLPDIQEADFLVQTAGELEARIAHEDPTLMEFARSLVERHNFLLYPLEPLERDFSVWAAAYHFVSREYQGMPARLSETADLYNRNGEALEEVLPVIREFEEISYPII